MFSTMTTLCDRRGVDGRASHGVNGEGRVGGGAKASRWRSVRVEHQFMDRRACDPVGLACLFASLLERNA